MSNLSQFAPFASGGLKSYQTGFYGDVATTGGGVEDRMYIDITVSAVSTTKSMLGVMGSAKTFQDSTSGLLTLTARLTSTTNLRLSSVWPGDRFYARWQIAEAN